MIKFCSLYSGSHGNCIFLGTERTKILIDAGVNAKHIEQSLRAIGENPKEISAILITHEHADHTQGAGVFARRHKLHFEELIFYVSFFSRFIIYLFILEELIF